MMVMRSSVGTWLKMMASESRKNAIQTRYETAVPSSAPRRASAPAVEPGGLRRVILLAPAAVRIR